MAMQQEQTVLSSQALSRLSKALVLGVQTVIGLRARGVLCSPPCSSSCCLGFEDYLDFAIVEPWPTSA